MQLLCLKDNQHSSASTTLSIAFLLLPALSSVNKSALHDHHDQNSQPVKIK